MGRAVLEDPDAQHGSSQHLPTALSALTSPANIAGPLGSLNVRPVVSRDISYSDQLTPNDGLSDGNIIPTIPGHVRCEPAMTPISDDPIESDMNLLVGGALAPVQTAPPRPPPPPKARPGLRLPSLERLGIAAPHPDRVGGAGWDATPTSTAVEGTHELADFPPGTSQLLSVMESMRIGPSIQDESFHPEIGRSAGRAIQSPIHHYLSTITPPADGNALNWDLTATVQIAGMHSPSTDAENAAPGPGEIQAPTSTDTTAGVPDNEDDEAMNDVEAPSWIDGAVDVLRKRS